MSKDLKNKNNKRLYAKSVYIILMILAIICVLGFIASVVFFIYNQKIIGDACSAAVNRISGSAGQQNALIEQSIYYLEKIQDIQESTKTNDVMSFIYSAVSSALIGLGVGLVANIYRNSEKVENAAESAKNAYKSYKKSLNVLDIQNIHIEIVNARMELSALNKQNANDRFDAIEERTLNFVNKINNYFDPDDEKENLERLREELCQLAECVNEFKKEANNKYAARPALVSSYLTAADNYNALLDEAIAHCNEIL